MRASESRLNILYVFPLSVPIMQMDSNGLNFVQASDDDLLDCPRDQRPSR